MSIIGKLRSAVFVVTISTSAKLRTRTGRSLKLPTSYPLRYGFCLQSSFRIRMPTWIKFYFFVWIKQIIVNDNIFENSKNISNAFNKYLVNVGNSSSRNTPDVINCSFFITSLIDTNPMNSFVLRPIAEKEVLNHINGLKSSKSTGRYGIPIKYIKLTGKIIAPILIKIYNSCIADGYFPDILKIAEVIPQYKTGPKNICTNYRPISILSPFSKIFEKCLHFRLQLFQ